MSSLKNLWDPSDKPTYLLDWDSTLCQEETLDFLAKHVLDKHELTEFYRITDQGMEGGLSFSESLAQRFTILKANRSHVEAAARELTGLMDSTVVTRSHEIKKIRDRIYVISGGFEELIMPSLELLGINPDNVYANRFLYDHDGYIKGADPDRLTSQDDGKAKQVEALEIQGIKVSIGDGYNDYRIKALGQADFFIAYTRHKSRDSVIPLADGAVDSFALIPLV